MMETISEFDNEYGKPVTVLRDQNQRYHIRNGDRITQTDCSAEDVIHWMTNALHNAHYLLGKFRPKATKMPISKDALTQNQVAAILLARLDEEQS